MSTPNAAQVCKATVPWSVKCAGTRALRCGHWWVCFEGRLPSPPPRESLPGRLQCTSQKEEVPCPMPATRKLQSASRGGKRPSRPPGSNSSRETQKQRGAPQKCSLSHRRCVYGLVDQVQQRDGGGWGRSDGKNKLMTNVHRREDMGRERHFAKSGWWFLEKAQVRTWPSRSHFLGIAASPLVLTNLLLLNLISPVSGGVGKGDIKDMGGAPGSKMRDWASLVKHPYGHGPYTRCPLAPLSTSSLSLESPCN